MRPREEVSRAEAKKRSSKDPRVEPIGGLFKVPSVASETHEGILTQSSQRPTFILDTANRIRDQKTDESDIISNNDLTSQDIKYRSQQRSKKSRIQKMKPDYPHTVARNSINRRDIITKNHKISKPCDKIIVQTSSTDKYKQTEALKTQSDKNLIMIHDNNFKSLKESLDILEDMNVMSS